MVPDASAGRRLPTYKKMLYGLGSVATGINLDTKAQFTLLFYSQVLGLQASLVGAAIMVALFVDTLLDVFIGQGSDRLRSAWGRRHPLMYISAVPLALSVYCLWSPPEGLTDQALFFYLLGTLIVLRLSLSLYEIPSSALAPELTADYDERTSLMAYRLFFQFAGGTAIVFLTLQVFLRKDEANPLGVLNRSGYSNLGIVAAIVVVIVILLSAVSTQSLVRSTKTLPAGQPRPRPVWADVKAVVTNQSFLAILASGIISSIMTGMTSSLNVYVLTFYWGLTPESMSYLSICVIAGAISGTLSASFIAKALGKKRAIIILFTAAIMCSVAPVALRLAGVAPPQGSAATFAMLLAATYLSLTLAIIGAVIVASMMADIVEDIAVRTGQRSEGLLFAANGLVLKAVTGAGTFSAGLLLDLIQFPRNATPDAISPDAIERLVMTLLPVQIGLGALSIAVLSFYSITRQSHEANVAKLRSDASLALDLAAEARQPNL